MTGENARISFQDLIIFSFALGAKKVVSDDLFPRSKEVLEGLRSEFYYAVRPVFLKFLPLIDPENISKNFSLTERHNMVSAKLPPAWSIHHQRPLSWGGLSFNPAHLKQIQRIALTQEQMDICRKCPQHSEESKLRFQLNNLLENAQKKGNLEACFEKLFKGYLIILPKHIHDALEKKFINIQKSGLPPLTEAEIAANVRKRFPLSYPVWDQFIFGGKHFERMERLPIVSKEERKNNPAYKKVSKKQSAALRKKRQRNFEHED